MNFEIGADYTDTRDCYVLIIRKDGVVHVLDIYQINHW